MNDFPPSGSGSNTYLLLHLILLTDPVLHTLSRRYAIDPFQQVREWFHVVLGKPRSFPVLDPGPGFEVSYRNAALTITCEVFTRLAGVFARQTNLEHAEDAQRFVLEAVDGIYTKGLDRLVVKYLPRD